MEAFCKHLLHGQEGGTAEEAQQRLLDSLDCIMGIRSPGDAPQHQLQPYQGLYDRVPRTDTNRGGGFIAH